MIMNRISTDPRNLPEIKGLKATKLPDPYESVDDIAVFKGWVQSLLSWFRLARMTDQKANASRLDVMQLCLKGPAKEWFGQEVLSLDQAIWKWSFRGAVLTMHRHFIHEAMAQQATDQFHVLCYDHKTGATAFFNDEYTFRRRFLDGLPHALVEDVLKLQGISTKYLGIKDILKQVKAMENVHNLKRVEDSRGPPRAFKVIQASRSRTYGGRPYRMDYRPKQNRELRKAPMAPMDTSKMTCYRCKGVGHIASERDKCPEAKGHPQQLSAAKEVDEDVEMPDETKCPAKESMEEPMEEGNQENLDEEDEGEPYGSQYLSEDESLLEQYEDNVQDNDSDVVHLHVVRVNDNDLPRQEDADVPKKWVYEDNHSVVHNHSCGICIAYKEHLATTREAGDDLLVENVIGVGQQLLHNEYIRGWGYSLEPPDASLQTRIEKDVGMLTSLMEGDHLLMEVFTFKLNELKVMVQVERLVGNTVASSGEATRAITNDPLSILM
ncbi:hypothetical protein BV22DRAFT_1052250 [Leucogyrophana mollusca]|uniref:Uncharacterized protein n=1 Tax=Leucogyrophana mollusca TaxID=85980 RepID=A0ACB8AZ40_9AGAM|nr:hypothetical protein BV22DRAFT_1052250 [Leucogyrophana mollusca]